MKNLYRRSYFKTASISVTGALVIPNLLNCSPNNTTNGIRLVKEWYDMGLLGQVKEVYAWQPPLNSSKAGSFVPSTSFPLEVQAI
jgi:hypothetical protein